VSRTTFTLYARRDDRGIEQFYAALYRVFQAADTERPGLVWHPQEFGVNAKCYEVECEGFDVDVQQLMNDIEWDWPKSVTVFAPITHIEMYRPTAGKEAA
jgi:hypothetical protein